jgi:hypothetical protein
VGKILHDKKIGTMTAKEKILQLINGDIGNTHEEYKKFLHSAITDKAKERIIAIFEKKLSELQKLKQIVENPAEVYISEVNPKVEVTFLNQDL